MSLLKVTFVALISTYTTDNDLKSTLWNEIEVHYSSPKRHYHTLKHLENLLQELLGVQDELHHWDTILFTLFYHDLIYDVLKSNNEEKSAEIAVLRMNQLAVSTDSIDHCRSQILATKSHQLANDQDTNYFTDADLAVLGQSWEVYAEYAKNVRKEYSIYPDLLYNPGRKKVLNHFLAMDSIYKTNTFKKKYENSAKENLKKELLGL